MAAIARVSQTASTTEVQNIRAPKIGIRKTITAGTFFDLRDYRGRSAVLKVSGADCQWAESDDGTTTPSTAANTSGSVPVDNVAEPIFDKTAEPFVVMDGRLWVSPDGGASTLVTVFIR